jgi:hypothetical protein
VAIRCMWDNRRLHEEVYFFHCNFSCSLCCIHSVFMKVNASAVCMMPHL